MSAEPVAWLPSLVAACTEISIKLERLAAHCMDREAEIEALVAQLLR